MYNSPKNQEIFYYSRRKLALYLFFNLGLLALAMFFTWLIFPEHTVIYYFAITTCIIATIAVAAVLIINYPLAVITPEAIKIDWCQPLKWQDITKANKTQAGYKFGKRDIIIFEVKNLSQYRLNFVQRLIKNSEFSAFSIPLYAMDADAAKEIESTITHHTSSIQ